MNIKKKIKLLKVWKKSSSKNLLILNIYTYDFICSFKTKITDGLSKYHPNTNL